MSARKELSRLNAAYRRGRNSCLNKMPKQCPYKAPDLIDKWLHGWDMAEQTRAVRAETQRLNETWNSL